MAAAAVPGAAAAGKDKTFTVPPANLDAGLPLAPPGQGLQTVPSAATSTTSGLPALSAPVPPSALPSIAIAVATDPGAGRVEVQLAPAELGRVRMQIACDGDDLRVLVIAERPETLDLLRRNAAALLSEFADAGFGRTSLDFAGGGMAAGRDGAPSPAPPPDPPAAVPPGPDRASGGEGALTVLPARAAVAGRLDLRL